MDMQQIICFTKSLDFGNVALIRSMMLRYATIDNLIFIMFQDRFQVKFSNQKSYFWKNRWKNESLYHVNFSWLLQFSVKVNLYLGQGLHIFLYNSKVIEVKEFHYEKVIWKQWNHHYFPLSVINEMFNFTCTKERLEKLNSKVVILLYLRYLTQL